MYSLEALAEAYDIGKDIFNKAIKSDGSHTFIVNEIYNNDEKEAANAVAEGDNLAYMLYLLKEKNMAGKFQLIYADPPFFSKAKYEASLKLESEKLGTSPLIKLSAYDDNRGGSLKEYLAALTVRLFMMKELLSESGCIWLHLDWHVVHYVKVIMDMIFGEENLVNEIIWNYKSGGTSRRSFARKHDTLLFYSKSRDYYFSPQREKSYNRDLKPYRFRDIEEFCDDIGWYTMVNMKDVWQIDMVGRTSQERNGYATQKPEKLMERIIASCSREGDLCGDFFAGSGSFAAVCSEMGRRWVMCDQGSLAVSEQIKRMSLRDGGFYVVREEASVKPGGRIKASVSKEPRHDKRGREYGDFDVSIILENYSLDMLPAVCSNMDIVKKYIDEDSLSMIKFWSIDFAFDGTVHRAERIITGNGAAEAACRKRRVNGSGEISILGYDVLGLRFHEIIYIGEKISENS